ncbi:MAG: transcription antitermination factor NusB [Candidatus Komeilibacteria bacterium CG10_big_fil_rev_8_21_14_0_10_41_13]|uniref:Transcription antitermination protein NusB n=1 Tax=Candidatus Komeilibacteria bacterium CG10_big_fil_rev_8_21_14_0_10_41_13 TaxID=1974476 RepID=A0A2M6WBP3_9BACT|nr:MAG: transcription antitermination factor NusB [Candidatus Komeilibacteria bacterium CG10_big_fil_rev_8_21_14_0_10_41_13]
MSNRHLARTLVLQSLFQWDFNQKKENLNKLLEFNKSEFAPDFDDQDFSANLLKAVIDKIDEIDVLIVKYAPEWPLDQITIVDRNVLRIGIYELKFSQDIPPKVAINEAIELAKKYGGQSSGKFVNGVLGSVYKDMQTNKEKVEFDQEPAREFSAGGVVFKKTGDDYKFALILDAYDKWTFPKGHIEEKEEQEQAALREVKEEIGIKEAKSHGYLGNIDIRVNDPNKRPTPKTIHYYLIETSDDQLVVPNVTEVKDVKWFSKEEALVTISYENALEIFQAALMKLKI